jgi:hypothetical protein
MRQTADTDQLRLVWRRPQHGGPYASVDAQSRSAECADGVAEFLQQLSIDGPLERCCRLSSSGFDI